MTQKQYNLLIALLVFIALGVVYIAWQYQATKNNSLPNQTSLPIEEVIETNTNTTQTQIPTNTDWRVYNNTDYGFQLTFRDTWKGYKVIKGTNPVEVYYAVCIPTLDKTWKSEPNCPAGYADPMTISVFSLESWNTLQKDLGSYKSPVKLGQNSKYVVAYSMWQDIPSDFRNTNLGFGAIVQSFKFVK